MSANPLPSDSGNLFDENYHYGRVQSDCKRHLKTDITEILESVNVG